MNIINRHNYEEYFLMYIDDELDATEKRAVEDFVDQHPDLRIELEMLQHSVLRPDPVVFHDKDVLLKKSSSLINETNYEEYFVLYGDDELDNDQKDCVEQFVYRNPKYQAEFELIQKARLQPDSHIVFPDKASLYRTEEEDEKVVVIRWWRIAAAAVIFIFLSGLGWYMISEKKATPGIVTNTPPEKTDKAAPPTSQPKQEMIAKTDPVVENNTTQKKDVVKQNRPEVSVTFQEKIATKQTLTVPKNDEKDLEGRNIRIASTVINKKPDVSIGKIETSSSLTVQSEKRIVDEAVGLAEANPYAYTASNDEIEILNTTVSKKNKLRGIFRKVSRVVEKTTNIETGDGKGIRIANFEIALK